MATRVERRLPDGTVLWVEAGSTDDCSVEVGFDAKGTLYLKSLKVYWQLDTDEHALAKKAEQIATEMLRVARRTAGGEPAFDVNSDLCAYCEHIVNVTAGPFGVVAFGNQQMLAHGVCFVEEWSELLTPAEVAR